jgi:hypothetical protein
MSKFKLNLKWNHPQPTDSIQNKGTVSRQLVCASGIVIAGEGNKKRRRQVGRAGTRRIHRFTVISYYFPQEA